MTSMATRAEAAKNSSCLVMTQISGRLRALGVLTFAALLLASFAPSAQAQQGYCVDASSGVKVNAGATFKQGLQTLRCCRMAPASGVPSNAVFLKEEQFKRILNPHRCWSGGLRTRDFVSVKIPDHPRRGRRLGR
jgi:hypothetical protein